MDAAAAESEPPAVLGGPCRDRDGEFVTHMGTLRRCRWLNLNDANERRAPNCGAKEIGLSFLESCLCDGTAETRVEAVGGIKPGAGLGVAAPDSIADGAAAASEPPTIPGGPCWDRDEEFRTHLGTSRQCMWLNHDDVAEERAMNCGTTEIRLSCLESFPCAAADVVAKGPASDGPKGERVDVHDATHTTTTVLNANLDVIMEASAATGVPTSDSPTGIPAASPGMAAPTLYHDCRGRFDKSGNVLTLADRGHDRVQERV